MTDVHLLYLSEGVTTKDWLLQPSEEYQVMRLLRTAKFPWLQTEGKIVTDASLHTFWPQRSSVFVVQYEFLQTVIQEIFATSGKGQVVEGRDCSHESKSVQQQLFSKE